MAGRPLPFPVTALPGRLPGESQGDLLNVYAVKVGDEVRHHRCPGLIRVTPALELASRRIPRGMLAVDNYLVSAWSDELEAMGPDGTVFPMTGAIPGDLPVTMARNIRDIPQIAIVTDGDAYLASTDTMDVIPYPETEVSPGVFVDNLGAVNSVEYYAGYFIFTRGDGTLVASGLQNAEIPDLSFEKAQYASDALLRGKNNGDTFLAMGTKTIEVWQDLGKTPFPMSRATVINVGLIGASAVAGGPNEWERGILFVASDYTVRMLDGYTATIIGNDAVHRDIYDARDTPDAIYAQVYSFEGQAMFAISHLNWTWEYNLSTGAWHRRESLNWSWWRAYHATEFFGSWYVQDLKADGIMQVTTDARDEDGERLRAMVESAAIRDFPVSVRVPAVDFDFTVGVGVVSEIEEVADPVVLISWSHDGTSWGNPLTRGLGQQGRPATKVTVHNLGRSTHQGLRLRWEITDPVPVTFRGASAPSLRPSRPRQVTPQ